MKSLFFLLPFFFFGCSMSSFDMEESGSINVVASFYPLAFLAESVGGDLVSVHNLAGSLDVHDYNPSPQDMTLLYNADLVFIQGMGLEPWVEDVRSFVSSDGVIVVSFLERIPSDRLLEIEDLHHDDHYEYDDHEDHADNHEHHDYHAHGSFDPHTWLDPVLAQEMVDIIAREFEIIAPEYTSLFQENAETLKQQFIDLDTAYTSSFSNCSSLSALISHNAFGYLEHRYGFDLFPIAGMSTQDEPSAQILRFLTQKAQEESISTILVERNKTLRFAETLASEIDLQTVFVNPLGQGPYEHQQDFFTVSYDNLDAFKTAFSCL